MPDFKDEEDDDLLVIMSMKEDDLEAANAAFHEFYGRYKTFIYKIIVSVCKYHANSNELISVIFNNSFINVYRYAGSFSIESKLEKSVKRSKIEAWLVRIAKTEFKKLITNYQEPINPDDYEDLPSKDPDFELTEQVDDGEISYDEEIIQKALSLLKERDRDIFWTYWMFYEKGKGLQARNLPGNEIASLVEKYETTDVNIRKIISRSKKIVFEYIEQNYDQTKADAKIK